MVAILITGCGKKVQALDFYEIDVNGMNSYAKAEVITKEDELMSAIADSVKVSRNSTDGMALIDSYMSRIKYNLEPKENLKNGDMVTLTVEYTKGDNDKVKIIGGKKQLEIRDLPEGTELDIFKDVKVNFIGVSPVGKVEVFNGSDEDFVKDIHFIAEPSSELKIGDKVTVKADYDKNLADKNMFIIKSDTKEYTVEKLDEYLDKASQFDNETKKIVLKEADALLEEYISNPINEVYAAVTEENYIGDNRADIEYKYTLEEAYFLVGKNMARIFAGDGRNRLLLLYSIELKNTKTKYITNCYMVLQINDIIRRSDGKIDVVYSSDSVIEFLRKTSEGFEREFLTTNKDTHTIEPIDFKAE